MTIDTKLTEAADRVRNSYVVLEVPALEEGSSIVRVLPGHQESRPPRSRRFRAVLATAAAVAIVAVVFGATALFAPLGGEDAPSVVDKPPPPPITTDATVAEPIAPNAPSAVSWTRVASQAAFVPTGEYAFMNAVTVGGPGLVAVGADCPGKCQNRLGWENNADLDAAVWTSADGENWDRIAMSEDVAGGPGDQVLLDIVAGGPGLVALGYDDPKLEARLTPEEFNAARPLASTFWVSTDGTEWERLIDAEAVYSGTGDVAVSAITSGGPGLVAVGHDGTHAAVWISSDGIEWVRVPHDESVFGGPYEVGMSDVTARDGTIIAVGTDRNGTTGETNFENPADTRWERAAVWRSLDGLKWERIDKDNSAFGGENVSRDDPTDPTGGPSTANVVQGVPGGFAATGYGQFERALWVSSDGHTWTRIADDDGSWVGGTASSPIEGFVTDGHRFTALVWEPPLQEPASWDNRYNVDLSHPVVVKTDGVAFDGKLIAVGFGPSEPAVWVGEWIEEGTP